MHRRDPTEEPRMRTRYWYGAITILAGVAAFVTLQMRGNAASAGEPHSTEAPPAEPVEHMPMPSPTQGGALEERLQGLVVAPASVPDLALVTAESGFYDVASIISIQEDPPAAARRYSSAELNGGYMRVFAGSGSIRQVQASTLNFRTAAGAAREFEFGRAQEQPSQDVTRLAVPFEGAFALAFTTQLDQTTLSGVLVGWVRGSDVSTIYVAGTDDSGTVHYALELAETMYTQQ
jgi:hypothetical protein